jgi:hypothetical protein
LAAPSPLGCAPSWPWRRGQYDRSKCCQLPPNSAVPHPTAIQSSATAVTAANLALHSIQHSTDVPVANGSAKDSRRHLASYSALVREVTSAVDNEMCNNVSPTANDRKHVYCTRGYTFDNQHLLPRQIEQSLHADSTVGDSRNHFWPRQWSLDVHDQ